MDLREGDMTRTEILNHFRAASDINALHLESLAIDVGSSLNDMPTAFFDEVIALAEQMGAERVAELYQPLSAPQIAYLEEYDSQ